MSIIEWILVIFILLCIGAIWAVHKISSEWKGTISLIIAIIGIIVGEKIGDKIIEKHYSDPKINAGIASLRAEHVRIIASQEEIKDLLRRQPPAPVTDIEAMKAMRDSLLAKIALLDKHIDRHFYRLDARFPSIDK